MRYTLRPSPVLRRTGLAARVMLIAALLAIGMSPGLAQPAGRGPNPADPALWVVRDDDTTIYLFGTIHVLKPGYSWFDGAVADAFSASDELVTEIPEAEFENAWSLLAQRAPSDDGLTISRRLTGDQLTRYRRAFARLGLPICMFERAEPWVPLFLLMSGPNGGGYSSRHGVETVLNDAADRRRMAKSALESIDMQLGMFDNLSAESQVAMLMDMVDAILAPPERGGGSATAQLDEMVRQWAAGDVATVDAQIDSEFREFPEFREFLLPNRNNNWAQWIRMRLAEPGGKFFVAVGAAHLHGSESVQVQLAEMGITTERVAY